MSTWGYSKDGAKIFDGEKLPEGWFDHPAKVPGSAAQKAYIADAEREGASIAFVGATEEEPPKDDPAKDDAPKGKGKTQAAANS